MTSLFDKVVESIHVEGIRTFYCFEGEKDGVVHQRVVTAVYKWNSSVAKPDGVVVSFDAAGCIYRRFDIEDGEIYYFDTNTDWNKKIHRDTALKRLERFPIKVDVFIPKLTNEDLAGRMIRGVGKQLKVLQDTDKMTRLYIRFARRKIERLIRKSFRNGCKGKN